jgi:hypothetical protein
MLGRLMADKDSTGLTDEMVRWIGVIDGFDRKIDREIDR